MEDIREGIVCWDLWGCFISLTTVNDGYCNHLDRHTFGCIVDKNRSVSCRAFDCRQDKRIWLDFENMIINTDINQNDWPECVSQEEGQENKP